MALPASDSFTQSDGNLSASWTTITGLNAPQVLSNTCTDLTTSGNSGAYWNADTLGNDQYAQMKIVALAVSNARNGGGVVRAQSGAQSFYRGLAIGPAGSTAFIRITRESAGTPTNLATQNPFTVNAGDTLKFTAVGTTLQVYINGVAVFATPPTDATYASGQPGLYCHTADTGAQTDVQLDDWTADNIVSGVLTRSRTLAAIGTRAGSRQVQAV